MAIPQGEAERVHYVYESALDVCGDEERIESPVKVTEAFLRKEDAPVHKMMVVCYRICRKIAEDYLMGIEDFEEGKD